ncbi:MAG: DUF5671 domain-containing protein [bacterium]|nr:DUF5671 domain-containing protein [bacterium]
MDEPVLTTTQPTVLHKSTSRDFFLQLFSLVVLITSITSLITLVFQLVNNSFPLPGYGMGGDYSTYAIRSALATLIVFFPAYIWSIWYGEKIFKADPARAMTGIRKGLIYFILFAVSLTLLINLVVIINTLLSGETTIRFAIKAFTVLIVALGVGAYYLGNLKRYATH